MKVSISRSVSSRIWGRSAFIRAGREVRVEHLAELLLPWRVERDHQIARELFGPFRRRVAGEVLPVLQDLVALRIAGRHPRAAGRGTEKRCVGMGERRVLPHDCVDVVQEVVVVEILVAKIPVLRMYLRPSTVESFSRARRGRRSLADRGRCGCREPPRRPARSRAPHAWRCPGRPGRCRPHR